MALKRKTLDQPQLALFAVDPKWKEHWWGMPSFEMGDARPRYRITVNLYAIEDLRELAQRLGVLVTAQTDSITFPPESVDKPSDWVYSDEA